MKQDSLSLGAVNLSVSARACGRSNWRCASLRRVAFAKTGRARPKATPSVRLLPAPAPSPLCVLAGPLRRICRRCVLPSTLACTTTASARACTAARGCPTTSASPAPAWPHLCPPHLCLHRCDRPARPRPRRHSCTPPPLSTAKASESPQTPPTPPAPLLCSANACRSRASRPARRSPRCRRPRLPRPSTDRARCRFHPRRITVCLYAPCA